MILEKEIFKIYEQLENNKFSILGEEEKMWEPPLLGVAAGDDPYFLELKRHIGEFHKTPEELFRRKYKEGKGKELRLLSLIFPQSEVAISEQRKQRKEPGDHWIVSRGEWEPLMEEFSEKMENHFENLGIRIVSTAKVMDKEIVRSGEVGLTSQWSDRHGAYAAGLGTFGLADAFISEKGTAIRIASYIIEGDFPVTSRGDLGLYDWCLYYAKGICGACIRRCPTRAITQRGHDKEKCLAYEDKIEVLCKPRIPKEEYMFGCGICQVGIPCEKKRP